MAKNPDGIDMSPAAVSGRIESMRALYKLALSLRAIKVIGPASGSASTGKEPRGS